MYIELWVDEIEEIITNYLKEKYNIIREPNLVYDNGTLYVKANIEGKTINNKNKKDIMLNKEAENITTAILESNFWMAGLGHFTLSHEQITEVIKTAISTKDQQERIRKLTRLYKKWQL